MQLNEIFNALTISLAISLTISLTIPLTISLTISLNISMLQRVAVRRQKELIGEVPNILHNPIILNQDTI